MVISWQLLPFRRAAFPILVHWIIFSCPLSTLPLHGTVILTLPGLIWTISLLASSSICIAGHRLALTGYCLASVHWQPALRDAYATSLLPLHPDLRPILPSSSGGLDTAVALFSAAVLRAASLSGMPAKVPESTCRKHAPFYDHECLLSKRRFRDAIQQALG